MNRLIPLMLGLAVTLAGFGVTHSVMASPGDCPFTSECPLATATEGDTTTTAAKGCENGCAMLTMEGDPQKCFDDLDLSDGQRDQTSALIKTLKVELDRFRKLEQVARIHFAAALVNGASDGTVSQIRDRITEHRKASLGSLEGFYVALRSILTQEQRDHLQQCVSCADQAPGANTKKKACCKEKAAQSAPQQPPACCEEDTR